MDKKTKIMNTKLLYLGALLALTVACQPSKEKENTTPQETTKADTLDGFYYDSVTGEKYATIDTFYYYQDDSLMGKTFYLKDPKDVEEDIHNQFLK